MEKQKLNLKKLITMLFAIVILSGSASAAPSASFAPDIIWQSITGATKYGYDHSTVEWLRNEGYVVFVDTAIVFHGKKLTQDGIDSINAAKLIIISINTNSSLYLDSIVGKGMAKVTTPVLCHSSNVTRSSQMRFFSTTTRASVSTNDTLKMRNIDSRLNAKSDTIIDTNGIEHATPGGNETYTLLANKDGSGRVLFAEFAAGVETYPGGYTPGSKWVFFGPKGQKNGVISFTTRGKELYLNTIKYLKTIPRNFTKNVTLNDVALSWDAVTGAVGYNVYRGAVLIGNAITTTTLNDENLADGTYNYTVEAVSAGFKSGTSSVQAVVDTELDKPANLIAAVNVDTVRLSWDAVAGAVGYNIYRNSILVGDSILVANYTDADVADGTYIYGVTAINGLDVESDTSKTPEQIINTSYPAPANLSKEIVGNDVTLKWDVAASALGYNVYRNDVKVGDAIANTFYIDQDLAEGTYKYDVSAKSPAGETSKTSISVTIDTKLPAPINFTANVALNVVSLSWDAVAGAVGYNVHRGTVLIGDSTTTTTLNDQGRADGTYNYTVKAINQFDVESDADSVQAVVKTKLLAPANFIATVSNDTVRLSWDAVTGAVGYNIYRNSILVGDSVLVANYTDAKVADGKYIYKVTAINGLDAESLASSATEFAIGKLVVADIIFETDNYKADSMTIDWIRSNNYTVFVDTAKIYRNKLLPQLSIDELNAAKLIIISRETNSSHFKTTNIGAGYKQITTPVLCQNAYVVRKSRMNLFNSDELTELPGANIYFKKINQKLLTITDSIQIDTTSWTYIKPIGTENYTLLADPTANGGVLIAEFKGGKKTYTSTADTGGFVPGGKWVFFAPKGTTPGLTPSFVTGKISFTDSGKVLYINLLKYLTTPPPAKLVPAPENLTGLAVLKDVTIKWSPVIGALAYNIYKDDILIGDSIVDTTFVSRGLADKAYKFDVAAIDSLGVESDIATVRVEVYTSVSAPVTLTAIVTGNNVRLSWSSMPNAVAFNVYRDSVIIADSITLVTYTDQGVANGTYTYAVTAINVFDDESGKKEKQVTVNYIPSSILGFTKPTISVYPVPFENVLMIDENVKINSLKVVNITGQSINYKLENNQLSMPGAESGLYFILINNEFTVKVTKK